MNDKIMDAIELLMTIVVIFLSFIVACLAIAVWWTEYIFIVKLILSALCVLEVLFSVYGVLALKEM